MSHPNNPSLRKITVMEKEFLWKRTHLRLESYEFSPYVEKVVIFLKNHKHTPLELLFRQEDNHLLPSTFENRKWCVGYPNDGVIWKFDANDPTAESVHINLNRPAVIAKIILHFLDKSWKPSEGKQRMLVPDALKLMEIIDFPLGIN